MRPDRGSNTVPRATRELGIAAPVSLRSLTLLLAFVAYCNPPRPQRDRFALCLTAARQAAHWLGLPQSPSRSARANLPLSAHLALLAAAGLLETDPAGLRLSATVVDWLAGPAAQQLDHLLLAGRSAAWENAEIELGLVGAIPPAYPAVFLRTLAGHASPPANGTAPATFWRTDSSDAWQLHLTPTIRPALLFDLLGLGQFEPPSVVRVSPLSFGAARVRDRSHEQLCRLFAAATGQELSKARRSTLREWRRRADAYRLRGPVLIASHPDLLAALYTSRRLRRYLLEQISPRCAIIDPTGRRPIARWLALRGYPLALPENEAAETGPPDPASLWLGLRVLLGLQRYAPSPFHPAYDQLNRLEATLDESTQAALESQAQHLLDNIDQAIAGRDAFQPSTTPPDPDTVARLRHAIAEDAPLIIHYQPLGDHAPQEHLVEPLRLEWRDHLAYLHAYSYRAEANRVFRLDRVISCCPPGDQTISTAPSSLAESTPNTVMRF
jgi:hypothetical protein